MASVPDIQFDTWYTYDQLTAFLQACAEARPDLLKLDSLVASPEGRQVWLATLTDPTTGAPEDKPAYYVQANVHARELAGTSAALRLIHTLLTDEAVQARLRELTFYVVPRTNPDGAEYAVTLNGPIRSRSVIQEKTNGLVPQDLDGDGKIRMMRWEDPAGPYVQDPEDPRLLVSRLPDDEGPFFQQQTEGLIHDYDGRAISLAIKSFDFNRHYPASWSHTVDAAEYPLQHPEIHAIAEFLFEHNNIFAGIDYHCGTQALLRVSGKAGELPESDLELMLEISAVCERLTGLTPMASSDYRQPWRKPISLPGNSDEFGYSVLGIPWFTIELGNSYSSAGIAAKDYFAADSQTRERDFRRQVLRFVDENPDHPWDWKPWTEFDHPQLGRVEIGGTGSGNDIMPHPRHIADLSVKTTDFILQHSDWHPQIALSALETIQVSDGIYRIRGRVANVGIHSTNVMSTAAASRTHEPVCVALELPEGVQIVSRPATYEFDALGPRSFRPLEWFVAASASAQISVRASHPRAGKVQVPMTLD